MKSTCGFVTQSRQIRSSTRKKQGNMSCMLHEIYTKHRLLEKKDQAVENKQNLKRFGRKQTLPLLQFWKESWGHSLGFSYFQHGLWEKACPDCARKMLESCSLERQKMFKRCLKSKKLLPKFPKLQSFLDFLMFLNKC